MGDSASEKIGPQRNSVLTTEKQNLLIEWLFLRNTGECFADINWAACCIWATSHRSHRQQLGVSSMQRLY